MSPIIKNLLGVAVILAILSLSMVGLVYGGVLTPEAAELIVVTALTGLGSLMALAFGVLLVSNRGDQRK